MNNHVLVSPPTMPLMNVDESLFTRPASSKNDEDVVRETPVIEDVVAQDESEIIEALAEDDIIVGEASSQENKIPENQSTEEEESSEMTSESFENESDEERIHDEKIYIKENNKKERDWLAYVE